MDNSVDNSVGSGDISDEAAKNKLILIEMLDQMSPVDRLLFNTAFTELSNVVTKYAGAGILALAVLGMTLSDQADAIREELKNAG